MSKELISFELPEDYKFVYEIKGCENKIDFDTNTIVEKILSTRVKKVDEEIIKQLKNIGESKGINELILIDESKVLKMIKTLKAFEIVVEKNVNIFFLKTIFSSHKIHSIEKQVRRYNEYCIDPKNRLTEEEYKLLKEII